MKTDDKIEVSHTWVHWPTDDELEARCQRYQQSRVWDRVRDHYAKLAGKHTEAAPQLACLILADYCVYESSGDRGGPTQEMVQLAEKILGTPLDKTIEALTVETASANPESADTPMTIKQQSPVKYDPALSASLIAKTRALIIDPDGEFPFPNLRAVDLAIRLVASGPKAAAVSASECHEITKAVIAAYDRDAFPIKAREGLVTLTDQLEAAGVNAQALIKETARQWAESILKAVSHLDSARYARQAGDVGSTEAAMDASRRILLGLVGILEGL